MRLIDRIRAADGVYYLLVTGSRDHPEPGLVDAALSRLVPALTHTRLIIVVGGCPGRRSVDEWASRWVTVKAIEGAPVSQIIFPAGWDDCLPACNGDTAHRVRRRPGDVAHPGLAETYCPRRGPYRNAAMVRLVKRVGCGSAVAFPRLSGRGSGTQGCVEMCGDMGVHVDVIRDVGDVDRLASGM